MRARIRAEAGFSLLEVLISVLVVALGLLAMAGMQLKSIRDSHDAYMRSLASELAVEAAERVRAATGDQIYALNSASNQMDLNSALGCYASGVATSACTSNSSTIQNIAASDTAYFASATTNMFGSGTVQVLLKKTDGTSASALSDCSYSLAGASGTGTACQVSVSVSWQEKAASGTTPMQTQTFEYRFR
ncbi:type IV pilus modification protein PilV [Chromobacterium haemolyticum]|uniref:Type IV pilus modification protein PilV n=1 Tax=Chromobacterium fluminis TaxID=3044269 RepID=A0ABX0LM44_9NEIS|nr:type IV pilus modification protein PilV [Chromobacterium haemolyticum]NHR08222.1 type IV pilus modification protein PilV [Chromobacterium haemolyticum]